MILFNPNIGSCSPDPFEKRDNQKDVLFYAPIPLLETDEIYYDYANRELIRIVRDGVEIWNKNDNSNR